MIIGISGKKQSGKDTVAKIINFLATGAEKTYVSDEDYTALEGFLTYYEDARLEDGSYMYPWQNVKFADKLKDIVCLLIGCTRETLESEEFKNTPLEKEWWYYENDLLKKVYTLREYDSLHKNQQSWLTLVKPTPRKLLQLMGTECGRQIIHPDIWVNATMANYRTNFEAKNADEWGKDLEQFWTITDVRFPNEVEAIKNKGGIIIRVERFCYDSAEDFLVCHPDKEIQKIGININKYNFPPSYFDEPAIKHGYIPLKDQHLSETALDSKTDWDYVINNVYSLQKLRKEVETILKKEGLIQ